MARTRSVKPNFFHDVQLLKLSPLHRLLFEGLWCYSDREGRLIDDPEQIKQDVLPADNCNIDSMLDELCPRLIKRYQVGRKRFIQVRNFSKHQNPHVKENASVIPASEPDDFDGDGEKSGASPVQAEASPSLALLEPLTLNLEPGTWNLEPAVADSLSLPEEEPLDFETAMHRFGAHKGFRKPNKATREMAALRWPTVALGEIAWVLAMDGYYASEWGKERNYPVMGLLKDPTSWIKAVPEPTGEPGRVNGAEKVVPFQRVEAGASGNVTEKIDYPARWNELVPAKPVQWDWKRSAVDILRITEADALFVARFDDMCRVAQAVHLRCRDEASWMTFEFAIRRTDKGDGWWRILTEFADMQPRLRKSPESGQNDDEEERYQRFRRGELKATNPSDRSRWVRRSAKEDMAEGEEEEAKV